MNIIERLVKKITEGDSTYSKSPTYVESTIKSIQLVLKDNETLVITSSGCIMGIISQHKSSYISSKGAMGEIVVAATELESLGTMVDLRDKLASTEIKPIPKPPEPSFLEELKKL